MTKAPERIWVWPDYNDHCIPFKQDWTHGFWDETEDPLGTEYVRADRIKAQAAEIKRLKGDLKKAVEAAASAACDWVNEDYGMSEAKAADLGLYRFVKRATRAVLRGGAR